MGDQLAGLRHSCSERRALYPKCSGHVARNVAENGGTEPSGQNSRRGVRSRSTAAGSSKCSNKRLAYRSDLESFLRWHDSPTLEKLTPVDVMNYRRHLSGDGGLQLASINRKLEALRRFCRWVHSAGKLQPNPAAEVIPNGTYWFDRKRLRNRRRSDSLNRTRRVPLRPFSSALEQVGGPFRCSPRWLGTDRGRRHP